MNKRKPYFPRDITAEQRFWAEVVKAGDDECWLWAGSLNSQGYGQFSNGGIKHRTHTFSYELHHGAIPKEPPVGSAYWTVCHACDVRACVNPNHLWLGTQSKNMIDAFQKGRLKLAPHIVAMIAAKALKDEAKRVEREERAKRMALGIEKKRNAMGEFGDAPVVPRLRDALGRMIKKGQKLPARQRDAAGLFI